MMPAKFVKFAAIGGTNTLLDFLIYNIVANVFHLSFFGLAEVVTAQICSATLLTPVSFLLNRRFTFKSDKKKRDTILPFVATNLFTGYIVQPNVIYFVVHVLGDAWLGGFWIFAGNQFLLTNFGKVCGVGFGMIINFLSYHFIFREKTAKTDGESSEKSATKSDGESVA